ncbi:helix-turn-helix domain-containing protein [Paracoccus aerius]
MTLRGFRPSRELDMKQEMQVPRVLGRGPNALVLPADMSRLWMAHRCVSDAKKRYGLSNGAISTLRALISFLREGGEMIVYAANATICKRADNQSERNLRRHLAQLVEAGLIVRRDSPNGKRYVIQHPDGPVEAFGLDLTPYAAVEGTRSGCGRGQPRVCSGEVHAQATVVPPLPCRAGRPC